NFWSSAVDCMAGRDAAACGSVCLPVSGAGGFAEGTNGGATATTAEVFVVRGGATGGNRPLNARDAICDDMSSGPSLSSVVRLAELVGCNRFLTRAIKSCG